MLKRNHNLHGDWRDSQTMKTQSVNQGIGECKTFEGRKMPNFITAVHRSTQGSIISFALSQRSTCLKTPVLPTLTVNTAAIACVYSAQYIRSIGEENSSTFPTEIYMKDQIAFSRGVTKAADFLGLYWFYVFMTSRL